MAEKLVFFTDEKKYYTEELIDYEYFGGFAVSQKQKCIRSLHESINSKYPEKRILEISTKSLDEAGVKLSAFNLQFYHEEIQENRHIENVFQSSKVFENGGPYRDLLDVLPKNAKRDERLKNSGKLIAFNLYNNDWPLVPRSMFYDWIYIKALMTNMDLAEELLNYDVFTDIEFNYKKQINCQARAAAIFVSLYKQNMLSEKTSSPEEFAKIYGC